MGNEAPQRKRYLPELDGVRLMKPIDYVAKVLPRIAENKDFEFLRYVMRFIRSHNLTVDAIQDSLPEGCSYEQIVKDVYLGHLVGRVTNPSPLIKGQETFDRDLLYDALKEAETEAHVSLDEILEAALTEKRMQKTDVEGATTPDKLWNILLQNAAKAEKAKALNA